MQRLDYLRAITALCSLLRYSRELHTHAGTSIVQELRQAAVLGFARTNMPVALPTKCGVRVGGDLVLGECRHGT
jgi:hypothetical protein